MNKISIRSNFSNFQNAPVSSFDKFYQFVKNNQWFSVYLNGQKYFFFAWRGSIFQVSEYQLAIFLSLLVFLTIVGIRKLCYKMKVKKKVLHLIKKIRGGSQSFLDLVDENDILHYEDELPDHLNLLDYISISTSDFGLTERQKFIKGLIKKCIKPGHFYKIKHRGVLEVLDKMMQFSKTDSVKVVTYDVLVLSLIIALKPINTLVFEGTGEVLKKIVRPVAIEYLPIIVSILTAGGLAFRVSPTVGFSGLVRSIVTLVVNSTFAFKGSELLRSIYLMDCADFVKQLPETNLKELPHGETLTELDSSSSSSSKGLIPYTREEPTRHEAFVATSPNQQLHYQEDLKLKIETLDGEIRCVHMPKGKKIDYMPDRKKPANFIEPTYIPLEYRTRTLKDLKSLDSTIDRESASQITKTVSKEQLLASLLKEAALNGE